MQLRAVKIIYSKSFLNLCENEIVVKTNSVTFEALSNIPSLTENPNAVFLS